MLNIRQANLNDVPVFRTLIQEMADYETPSSFDHGRNPGAGRIWIAAWIAAQLTDKKSGCLTETECCLTALHSYEGEKGGIGNGKVGCVASEHQ